MRRATVLSDSDRSSASLHGADDELPGADPALLVPVKRSPEYRAICRRVASPQTADAWQLDAARYFWFLLWPGGGAAAAAASPPVALFAVRPEGVGPACTAVVTPSANGEQAEVADLGQPQGVYTVPLAPRR